MRDGTLIVAVRERAIDGRANAAIERAVAVWLGIRVSSVSIVAGGTGRRKLLEIAGLDAQTLARRLAAGASDAGPAGNSSEAPNPASKVT